MLDDAWVVVDRVFKDLPVVAWSDFEADCRDNLHDPVSCKIRLYHAHASLILDQVLRTLDRVLGEHLEAQEPKSGEDVLTFTRGK